MSAIYCAVLLMWELSHSEHKRESFSSKSIIYVETMGRNS